MVDREIVNTKDAPSSKSPLSQAVRHGNLLFVSGTVPVSPTDGKFVGGDITVQTKQVLENIAAILSAGGSSLSDVLKVTAFLTDIESRHAFNDVYATFFPTDPPARSTFEVSRLADKFEVEVEVIAAVS